MSLEGRVALVTGAGRGIGAAAAHALAEAGASVAVAARTRSDVEAVAASIERAGGEAVAVSADVTDEASVRGLVDEVGRRLGAVDILVNNAGSATANRLGRTDLAEWDRLLAVNATSAFLCTRAVFDGMRERGHGRIVNLASMAGLEGKQYVSAYTAAKHALVGFTRAVAAEAADADVVVAAVCPGYVDTPLTEGTVGRVVERTGRSPEAALRAVLDAAGQRALVTPAEVAAAVVGLCRAGPEANGRLVVLDGNGPAWSMDGLASPRRVAGRSPDARPTSTEPSTPSSPEISMSFEHVNPAVLGKPSGWTNGMLAPSGGRVLFVAGQDAAEPEGLVETDDFLEQFDRALAKLLAVVEEAGGGARHIGRMTIFVTDLDAYRTSRGGLGDVWRARMGRNFPAMALVEVKRLVDPRALLEIEATAVLPAS